MFRTCIWIRENLPADALFITPYAQQTFKWYAHRTEVFCWKDIPQDATRIVEWDRRFRQLHQIQQGTELELLSFSDDVLLDIAQEYAADYLVLPQRVYDLASRDPDVGKPRFKLVYPDAGVKASYVVLKFGEGESVESE